MKITVDDRGTASLRARLDDRLKRAAALRCADHGSAVIAVKIVARENGWFDALWTTCCDSLNRDAAAIVRDRC
jgi:uncharacterized protein YqkB